MASIGLRQRVFTVGHSPFAHNYLVLYDDQGNVAGELHGFAADPVTGEESLFGRSTHNLKAFDYTGKKCTARMSRSRFFGRARMTTRWPGGRWPEPSMTKSIAET